METMQPLAPGLHRLYRDGKGRQRWVKSGSGLDARKHLRSVMNANTWLLACCFLKILQLPF